MMTDTSKNKDPAQPQTSGKSRPPARGTENNFRKTERISRQAESVFTKELAEALVEATSDCVQVLDANGFVTFANIGSKHDPAAQTYLGEKWTNFWPADVRPEAEEKLRQAQLGQAGKIEGLFLLPSGHTKWCKVTLQPVSKKHGANPILVVARETSEPSTTSASLEQRVRITSMRAQLAEILGQNHEISAVLQEIGETLHQHFPEAALTRIWVLHEADSILELKASSGLYRHINGRHSRIPLGELKIGRIAKSGRPHLTNDVLQDTEISDPAWARREGIQSFAGYPFFAAGKIAGVVALFSRVHLPATMLDELSFAAKSIGQFVQRKRADEARRRAEEKLLAHSEVLEKTVAERTEHLKQTIGDLEAFSYSVSHDLRAPLRAIEGYAEALLEDCSEQLDAEHLDYLLRIKSGALRLDRLTLDVLAYSRWSRLEFEASPVDVEELVREILEQYSPANTGKARIEVESPLLPMLGHSAFLVQSISNLLNNALKFVRGDSQPLIKIWSEKCEDKVRLNIADNGIGIAPENESQIFEIFRRVQNPKSYEGSGIGLAVVKRAVDRMNGNVGFSSKLGSGTRFWIELPAAPQS